MGELNSKFSREEFERILILLDGTRHREMFRTWVANHLNAERVDRTFDGAILKFIRIKKGYTLADASKLSFLSIGHLSKIENGQWPTTIELRKKIMLAYGYSPSSFKNLSRDPVRSKAVPPSYKLAILMKKLTNPDFEHLLKIVEKMAFKTSETSDEQLERELPHEK